MSAFTKSGGSPPQQRKRQVQALVKHTPLMHNGPLLPGQVTFAGGYDGKVNAECLLDLCPVKRFVVVVSVPGPDKLTLIIRCPLCGTPADEVL